MTGTIHWLSCRVTFRRLISYNQLPYDCLSAGYTMSVTQGYPPHLNLTGQVVKKSRHAVARGGFGEVYVGSYNGRRVAIKAIRFVNVGAAKIRKVCTVFETIDSIACAASRFLVMRSRVSVAGNNWDTSFC